MGDVSARAYGVTVSSPYLDQKMIEFAFSVPSSYKVSLCKGRDENKIVMRRALRSILPQHVISSKKVGFGQQNGSSGLIKSNIKEFVFHVLFPRRLEDVDIFRMT